MCVQTEQSYKRNPKLLDQLQYCEERNIPLAIVIGESELQRGIVKLRVIETRQEVPYIYRFDFTNTTCLICLPVSS